MRASLSTASVLCVSSVLFASLAAYGQQPSPEGAAGQNGPRTGATLPILAAPNQAVPDLTLLQGLLTATRPPLTFHTDDVLSVNVIGIDNYAIKQRVGDDGTIVFPLIGRTQVSGLTTQQLQSSIASALAADGMVLSAQVSITTEVRPDEVVSVLGDVIHPGVFPANGNLTVADYLSQASGFIENAPGQGGNSAANYNVTLVRPSLSTPVLIPMSPKAGDLAWGRIPLFPGDQIRVDKVGIIYAVGAFRSQGSFQLKNNSRTTVTQLVALAGGIGYEAAYGDTHIVRRNAAGTTLIAFNISKVLKGKEPDIALEADDILFVPTNQLKAVIKGGGPALLVSVASAAIYGR